MKIYSGIADMVRDLLYRGFYSTAFQPIVDMERGLTMGFEALLRGPEMTPLSNPGRLFNKQGVLPQDALLALDMACITSALKTGKNLPDEYRIFINVLCGTIHHMLRDTGSILSMIEEVGIDPSRIVFELSETTGVDGLEGVSECICKLSGAGIKIALDDIGVRSPYLYHLLYLEPEYMKIDRLFIKNIDQDGRKQALVESMVHMASRMGAKIIAEGVEHEAEYRTLRSLGIQYVQGFFIGRPGPADEWLKQERVAMQLTS